MLYYKKVKKEVPVEMAEPAQCIRDTIPAEITEPRRHPMDSLVLDELSRTSISDRQKLYESIMEGNFNNLSVDDKLVILYKTIQINNEKTNNYILLCLAMLVILVLKLYSKN